MQGDQCTYKHETLENIPVYENRRLVEGKESDQLVGEWVFREQ